jgi:drug/metabolite transporter (DMT)-like permease
MAKPDLSANATARLMLVLLSLGWGTTWPMMRIVLDEVPPFSMRVATMVIGAVTLGVLTVARRRSFALHSRVAAVHVTVAGLFNIVSFSILTPFAQLYAATSRVSIVVYSMPIWATLMARIFLGERITGMRAVAFALCVAGLVVLVWPLAVAGIPGGILLALGQPVFEGPLHLWPIRATTLGALIFAGLVGSGIAYFLWFEVVRRLSAMTASLGVLASPAVGVVASVIMLGERPTLPDMVGFALILAASACVLLAPGTPPDVAEAK